MLEIEDLHKTYQGTEGRIRPLAGLSLSVAAGEFVAIQGRSGCGKSTLLLIAGGLLEPDSGRVVLEGTEPYSLSPEERARFRASRIGFVFQQFHLIPYLSVLDNILAPALALEIPDARNRARDLTRRFGLEARAGHVPAQLSVGERQRAAMARALLTRPRILLADEPTGNLDGENAEAVLGYLGAFAGDGGAVLLVTHDAGAATQANRTLRLEDGKLE